MKNEQRYSEINILQLNNVDQLPLDLLLLADPSLEQVMKYASNGECYVAVTRDKEVVGVYVLLQLDEHTVEIMNIAVAEHMQGKGLGKTLIQHALNVAKTNGMTKVEIGTGNSSINQLALYQKCGFRITGIIEDFFIQNYREPIFENGIQCRDMVRLAVEIK